MPLPFVFNLILYIWSMYTFAGVQQNKPLLLRPKVIAVVVGANTGPTFQIRCATNHFSHKWSSVHSSHWLMDPHPVLYHPPSLPLLTHLLLLSSIPPTDSHLLPLLSLITMCMPFFVTFYLYAMDIYLCCTIAIMQCLSVSWKALQCI